MNAALIAGFRPQNALEHELVERIVSVLWRLRRVPAFEAALMAWLEKSADEDEVPFSLIGKMTGDLRLSVTILKLASHSAIFSVPKHRA